MFPRVPVSDFPTRSIDDPDISAAYWWFRSFMSDRDWEGRKAAIEVHLSSYFRTSEPFSEPISKGTLLVIEKDRVAWYVYLVHTYLFEHHKYEFFQGARVVPIFKRIGLDLEMVKGIDGVDKKMRDLFRRRTSEADSVLFEILTALMWSRNGWEVKILQESSVGKTPDLLVEKGQKKWEVECKRQKKTSDYTYRETEKRQKMVSHLSKTLIQLNILLDVTFHVELVSLPDTYLMNLLEEKLKSVSTPGLLVSNAEVEVRFSYVDIQAIQHFARNYFLKNNSPHLLELIAGKQIEYTGFTSGFLGAYYFVGEGEANNLYIADIVNAFGVICSCDSPDAIAAKARDVRNQINDAIRQFRPGAEGIIHIGMETHDGPAVEKARVEKLINTMKEIDSENSGLGWIYYHYFQSYSRSYMDWYMDETVSRATPFLNVRPPLQLEFLVVPNGEGILDDASHWEREVP